MYLRNMMRQRAKVLLQFIICDERYCSAAAEYSICAGLLAKLVRIVNACHFNLNLGVCEFCEIRDV
jgi:hypothetical protein